MKGLFFTQYKESADGLNVGPVNKILDQIEAFNKAGFCVTHINHNFVETGLRSIRLGKGILASLPFTYVFAKNKYRREYDGYDFYYIRFEAADRYFTKFLRDIRVNNPNAKIVVEFPDYPNTYWMNSFLYVGLLLKDFFARSLYKKYIDRFAVLDQKYADIYGVKTLLFRNGINIERIPIKSSETLYPKELHLIGVASMYPFHGFDRLIRGLHNYYGGSYTQKVVFHVVGDGPGPELQKYKELVTQYKLENAVVFEGRKTGDELAKLFNLCDVAVGSLGMFRIGFDFVSSLKIREYLARGVPILIEGSVDVLQNSDFSYFFTVYSDETPVDIHAVVDFTKKIYTEKTQSQVINEIRTFAEETCDTAIAMKEVIEYIKS